MAQAALIDRASETDTVRQTVAAMFRYRELVRHLVAKDLKLKYRGSVLGFVWSLLNPLIMVAVYTIAFKYIIGVKTPKFVFYLLVGILAWNFFVNSLMMATGSIIDNPCADCHGSGIQNRTRTITVRIPPGVSDGQKIRLAGQGEAGLRGAPSGDLYVTVHVSQSVTRVIRGDKKADFSPEHDLAVQETLLRACGLPVRP